MLSYSCAWLCDLDICLLILYLSEGIIVYVVSSAYTIMLSRYRAHTKQVEQTNSVITYYCAVSVPFRSNRISRTVLAANILNRIVWTSAYGCISRAVGRFQYLVVHTFKGLRLIYRGDRVVL